MRWYLDALLKGNPFAVGITIIGVVAVSMGPFHNGLSRKDPGAIALASLVGLGALILLTVLIVDRRSNAPKKKRKKRKKPARSGDPR